MKAEINIKNKEKFFAQYHGQCVLTGDDMFEGTGADEKKFYTMYCVGDYCDHDSWLLLKHVHEISGDEVLKIFSNPDKTRIIKNIECGWLFSDHSDILRSKGYAVPWMGLSVVQLEKAGWIKFTTND